MILANHTLTVYNKYHDSNVTDGMPPADFWNRTVIKYGQWENTSNRTGNEGRNFIEKLVLIIIPKTAKTGGKQYVPPQEWTKLPVDKKLLTWTLQVDADQIAWGEAPEITDHYPMATMRQNFENCLIKIVKDLCDQPLLPHWEITAI